MNIEPTPLGEHTAGQDGNTGLLENPNEGNELVVACADLETGSIPPVEEITKDNKIVPLTGKRYFTCIVCKSHIQEPYHLVVPKWFTQYLPSSRQKVSLWYKNKTWELRYGGDWRGRRFDSGWKTFSIESDLKLGDGLVFELMDEETLEFRVQILRGNVPDIHVNLDDGKSSGSPIIIN
ncbi:B3 domain-containing protein [Rhynchospora pubera]|uniref:B3 domain-containing protein n=1 Tax=Rhynchospora pubera TaxID=906938 RepID=A0AAV8CTT9_9POAL|nr:B3 domain-containing protein [Rhynchospora pubera]KAJ4811548.1 B3 domain-containing protein [Rhynchospora pubera]